MLASPSIQEIASALARTSRPLSVRQSSRILCLKLQPLPSPGFKRCPKSGSMQTVAEAFLKYSPRVSVREDRDGISTSAFFVFVDIASTSHFYQGEGMLMRSAMSLARDLGFSAQCAVADTPAGAQAFAAAHPETILPPGEERDRLKELSLPHLLHLEGLKAWDRPKVIESVVTFFMMLGFKTVGDLSRFTLASLQERWGDTGALMWQRLNAQDRQVVSPLLPTEPLEDYVHLDFPVSLTSLLLHQLQKSVEFLFARLQGRRLVAHRLTLILHCEYSKTQHKLEIEPNSPSRDRDLFLTLIENRLNGLDLENPIRDFEVRVEPTPEKSHQLDFFEPRERKQDKLETLLSLLTQSQLRPGLYRIEPAVLPERGWRLAASTEELGSAVGLLEPAHFAIADDEREDDDDEVPAVASLPCYGASVMRAPRPTRVLREPLPLSLEDLERLQILSTHPIERLENAWWEPGESPNRDYYFAVSPEGQCLWIFQDPRSEEYFLHGYFD